MHDRASRDRESELRLIDRARLGEAVATRELIDRHKDRLFSFIWRMVRDHHDAEDICQDAFLKAFASLDSFNKDFRFSTWLFTIGYRVCLNRMRRKKTAGGELDFTTFAARDGQGSAEIVESEEAARLREVVWSAVDALTPPQRATVVLFYRHDLSCQEIAKVVELPLATVKSHLHRARLRLRETLGGVTGDEFQEIRNLSRRSG